MKLIFVSLLAITPPALAANKTWDADESDTVRYDLPTEPHHLDEPISEPDRQNNVQNTQSGLCTARDGQSGLCKPPTTCGLKDNKVDPCNPEPKCGTQVASAGQRIVCCPSAAETFPPPNERACGKPGTATRIIGGTEVAAHAYPWQVGLFVNHGQGRGSLICGGTIIHRHFILTAAHCIRDRGPQDFYVLVGAHNSKTDGRFVGVVKVMTHENYRQESRYNDITIMKLSRNVSYGSTVKPACLPTKEMDEPTYVGRRATVTGWGTEDKSGGRKDNNLKETQVPIKYNEVCTKAYCRLSDRDTAYPYGTLHTQWCAGEAGHDTCSGDSGGPMVLQPTGDKRWYLFGVTSFGKTCDEPDWPGVYTRVSAYLTWIGRKIKDNL